MSNTLFFNQKIELILSDQDKTILDSQSKMLNYLYNYLLEKVINEYKQDKFTKVLNSYNLRNLVPIIKKEKKFLNTIHSSPLKNTALRLKQSFVSFFNKHAKFPKFRSWKLKWFSLYYDEPNKGIKIDENNVRISLGANEEGKRLYIHALLKESLRDNTTIKNFRITKENKRYYLIVCMEKEVDKPVESERFIAIDPNHKNFFVGIDYLGNTIEFNNISMIKYLDKEIDRLKSKRDKCVKKNTLIKTPHSEYFIGSKRYKRLDNALGKSMQRKREQTKQALYRIANMLTDNYDVIAIGDYFPSNNVITNSNQSRSMLNQTVIGKFRKILEWVCKKKSKTFILVDEHNTTKTCSLCGHEEKKDPSIREFRCNECGMEIERDKNSAINIATKAKLILSGSDYLMKDSSFIKYTLRYNYKNSNISIDEFKEYLDHCLSIYLPKDMYLNSFGYI